MNNIIYTAYNAAKEYVTKYIKYVNTYSIHNNKLTFVDYFNKNIDDFVFPDNIKHIIFGEYFDQKIDNIIFPENLHTIIFGKCFDQNIDNVKFPENLHTIIFGDAIDQNIDNVKFPENLHIIKFGMDFHQNFHNVNFPENLHILDVSNMIQKYVNSTFFQNMCIPYTIKEVIIHEIYKGHIRLPYGCVETIAKR